MKYIAAVEVMLLGLVTVVYLSLIPTLGHVNFTHFNGVELVTLFTHIVGGVITFVFIIKGIYLSLMFKHDERSESQN